MNILTLLRKKEIPTETSQQIREALEKVQAELPAAREAYEAAEDKRDDLVLDGTEKDRDAAEAEAIRLERIWRDLDIVRAKLTERYDEALKREKRSDLMAAAAEGKAAVDRQCKILTEIAPMLHLIIERAEEFRALSGKVLTVNTQLEAENARDLVVKRVWSRAMDAGWVDNQTGTTVVPLGFPDIFTKYRARHEVTIRAGQALARAE